MSMIATRAAEEYRGQTYYLEKRQIMTFANDRGYTTVWCWMVTSGPNEGIFGGKCATKAEARRWARHTIRIAHEEQTNA